ncbi:DUF1858 domain-containing protein [Candidatus Woesearchaeota archaeon]|nr:DUF1858 domain-containing protein [Candidatus Woesearchaeota archaeon]
MVTKHQITKKMSFVEVIDKFPMTVEVMLKYGLHCVGCHMAATETIEEGSKGHGMDDEQIDEMIEEMNEKIAVETEEDYSDFEDESAGEEE